MSTTKLTTAADLTLLEGDGYRYELIKGELERMAPATLEHAWTESWFVRHLGTIADAQHLGAVFGSSAGYVFGHNPDTVLEPDVSFVRADRLPRGADWRAFAEVVPDLVVEIVSPSERKAHLDRKIAIYLAAGVRLVWYVDPRRRSITVFAPDREPAVLHEADELDAGSVVPGFRTRVAECFPPMSAST
jgi:Uma2 family endonuclease